MRVLHVINPHAAGRFALAALGRLLRDPIEGDHDAVVSLGGSDAERLAAEAGVRTFDRLHPPGGRAEFAARPFRKLIAARGEPDLVHAWSLDAGRLASLAIPCTPRIVVVAAPKRPKAPGPSAWFHRPRNPTPTWAVFSSETARQAWLTAPDALARLIGQTIDAGVARFPVDARPLAERVARDDPDAEGVRTLRIALLDGGQVKPDAWTFTFALGAATLAGWRVEGVAPPSARALERAARMTEALGHRWRLRVEPINAEALVHCDLAVATDADRCQSNIAPLAEALAMEVPLVAHETPAVRELLGDVEGAWLSSGRRPIDLATALVAALEQPNERARRTRLAAERVGELWDFESWRQTIRLAHQRAAGAEHHRVHQSPERQREIQRGAKEKTSHPA